MVKGADVPRYSYKCECRVVEKDFERDDPFKDLWDSRQRFCETCGAVFCRQWTMFQSARPGVVGEGYVVSAFGDKPLTSREIEREAARVSEEYTARTGIETNLEPVSWNDPVVAPKSDDGMKEQHDGQVARGEKDSSPKMM